MKKILIEISPAEFLDRLSIINIKLKNIKNPKMEVRIKKAKADLFSGNLEQFNIMNDDIYVRKMYLALQEVNKEIWVLEDIVRSQELVKRYGGSLEKGGSLETYRSITSLNESKEAIKSKIDSHLKS